MVLISTPRFKSGEFFNAFKETSRYTKFHMTYDDAIYDDGTRQMPEDELEWEAQRCGGRDTAYFKREYCAEFGNSEDTFFDDEGVEQSLVTELKQIKYGLPGHKYTIGADLALSQDYTIFAVLDCTDKKNLKIVNTERFTGKSTDQIMDALYQKAVAFHPKQILIDDAKIGAAVVSHLTTNYPGYSWKPFNFNTSSKVPLMTDLNIAMGTGIIQIPDDDIIREELLSFYYEENKNTGHLKLGGVGCHDDYPIAIGLALRAANVFTRKGDYAIGTNKGMLKKPDTKRSDNRPTISSKVIHY
jgi:phage FluMu gp28-like protein